MLKSAHVQITPYYQALLDSLGPDHPLRRTVVPSGDCVPAPGELADPLGEEAHCPVPGLVHTYPDKVLLFATLRCAVYCRYCTRGRLVGSSDRKPSADVFRYLEMHSEIRDVLISGGDPFMLSDTDLSELFSSVRKIRHIRTVRLGSKVPAVLPSRVTPELAAILSKYRIWLQLHFIHPAELTGETTRACGTLADAGVPMVSQTVLLKGINDDAETLAELFYGLLERRVKPYYLFQCDPVFGSSGFRTPVEKGLQILRELQGRVSGLALPHYCIDAPGGGGKITLLPDSPLCRDGDEIVLKNYEGREYRYPDPEKGGPAVLESITY
ncbi:MAG: KamA family radical SAM protein [Pontiellaceae bacterium]|jgi:lysine 2,3-aminomutase|nr:KamA family radical SAM protein [Pontiellaceae bacterium]